MSEKPFDAVQEPERTDHRAMAAPAAPRPRVAPGRSRSAINGALDYLDSSNFPVSNFDFVQIPHHGSHHNVGPTLLNRMLGPKLAEDKKARMAFVSASKNAPNSPWKKSVR